MGHGSDFNMNKFINKKYILASTAALLLPVTAAAKTFAEFVDDVTGGLAKTIVKFIFSLAVMLFLWGIVQYTLNPTTEGKDKGRMFLLWGIIALTVMFSVYGLIRVLQGSFF